MELDDLINNFGFFKRVVIGAGAQFPPPTALVFAVPKSAELARLRVSLS